MEGAPPRNGLTLLLVEDDMAAIEILAYMIRIKFPQLDVVVAYNGQMGLEKFGEHRPAIVVTDINMPKMDGLEMAKEIMGSSPDTTIMVLTAYSDRIHVEQFQQIGISEHFLKPVEFEVLFAAIRKAVAEIQSKRRESVRSAQA